MNNRQRFLAAVEGVEVDYPPCTVWMHFVTDRVAPEEVARRHARFVTDNGWDMCKVMNDYRLPLPDGLETIASPQDMLRFRKVPKSHTWYALQPAVIRSLRTMLGADMPIIDTSFDPFQQVVRKVGYTRANYIYEHPEQAAPMLDAVTDSMCEFLQGIKRAGCDAVLYSINGAIRPPAARGIDDATFRTFLRPYDLRVLEAMKGMVRILHVHGTHVDMNRVLDYPCEVFSVSDRLAGNPSLAELRAMTDKCLMGGVNEERIAEVSPPELRAECADALRQAGRRKLMLTPGCSVPPQTPAHILDCLRQTTRALGGAA